MLRRQHFGGKKFTTKLQIIRSLDYNKYLMPEMLMAICNIFLML